MWAKLSKKLVTDIICLVTKIALKTTYGSYTFYNERAALSVVALLCCNRDI